MAAMSFGRRLLACVGVLVVLAALVDEASCESALRGGANDLTPPVQPGPPNRRTKLIREPLTLGKGNGPLCYVQRVEVRKAGSSAGGDTTFVEVQASEGSSSQAIDVSTPRGLLQHVSFYTELDDLADTSTGGAKGALKYPENIEFRRVTEHYFSDIDPRATYAILGTPGGDIGEFINALAAYEKLQGKVLYAENVSALLQQYLNAMISRGRRYFYMSTDKAAQDALATASGVTNPLSPSNADERNKILREAVNPAHVGCPHLKGMLSDAGSYAVRKEIVEWTIQSFFSIYFDALNPLRQHMLLVVHKTAFEKAPGGGRIWSPDECPGIAPLLVPNTDESKAVIFHEAHVAFFRQDLARFFSFQNAIIETSDLFREIQNIAKKQLEKLTEYTDAQLDDVIFTSMWDRWPF